MQILFHSHFKMTAPPLIPVIRNLLVLVLISGIAADAQEGPSSAEIQTDTSSIQQYERDDELPANRVLPVDAEHKSKISFPQQALDPICMNSLRENLVNFLNRVKRSGVRQARQDDGDDGDDGDEGGGGLLAGLGEGNGALAAFAQLPSILPSFVSTLTQLSGAVNQGLNGTDTPNLPSFLVKQGQQLIQALTASQSSRAPQPRPPPVHVQRIPGSAPGGPAPPRKPRPPGYDPEDYIDEDVKQPLQPTLPPLNQAIGFQRPSGYDPYPGNPFLENADIRKPISTTEEPYIETINGLPPKTSLWEIYKSFRNRPSGNGSLSEFQLAHPAAFSNELLQSISNSISNIRGQGPNVAAPTDKPTSEILKEFHPPGQPHQSSSSLFLNHERPSLSIYKPATSISGVGVDLSHLAQNASKNNIVSQTDPPTSGEVPDPPSSIHAELDFESVASLGVPQNKPGGSGGVDGTNRRHTYSVMKNVGTTGSLAQLQAQAQQGSNIKNPAHFVKSPTSSHLALAVGSYVPAVSSLHEDLAQNVGPQTNEVDTFNGVVNKTPYRPVGNGVLLQAPRLTPSPIFDVKPPSSLYINANRPTETTPSPEYSFSQVEPGPVSSLFPAQSLRPKDPNPPRAPTVNAVISSKLPQFSHQNQNSHQNNGILPPSLIPQNSNSQLPQSGPIRNSPIQSIASSQEEVKPEEDIYAPPTKNKNFIASSLVNIAEAWPGQGTNFQQASNPNYASSGDSPNAPGSPNQGYTSTESSLLQNSKLLLYLLTNFPELLVGQNANPSQMQVPSEIPNEIMDSFASSVSETTPIPQTPPSTTVAPQVQKEIVTTTSTLAPVVVSSPQQQNFDKPSHSVNSGSPFVVPDFSPVSNKAPALRQSTPSPTKRLQPPLPSIQTGPLNSDLFSSNWANNLLLAPSGISGSDSSSNNQPQQTPQNFVQINHLPFGSLLQGPASFSDVSTAKTETEIEEEPTTTTSQSDIQSTGLDFPSGSFEANPVDTPNRNNVNNNKFSQTVQNIFASPFDVPIQEPIPASTSSSILSSPEYVGESISQSVDSGFPSLSQLYGNSPAGQNVVQPKLEQTSPIPVITSTPKARPTPAAQQENLPPLNYPYLNFYPDSVPDVPPSSGFVPPLPPPLSLTKPAPIVRKPSFQGPSAIGGYPADVPFAPLLVAPAENQIPPFGFPIPVPEEPSKGPSSNPVDSSNQNNEPNQLLPDENFSQKLSSAGPSAILEMSKLPFFQQDSFRPSALLQSPYVVGNNGEKEEDSFEQMEPETEKPISELFSSVLQANVSTSNEIVTSTVGAEPIQSVIPEEDSIEQQIPNFPPGKPAYWMNMYYPNGIPVLTKVRRTTTEATTMKPKRRRRSTTPAPPPTTTPVPVTESEYYEDDDPTKPKRRKSHSSDTDVDFVTFTT